MFRSFICNFINLKKINNLYSVLVINNFLINNNFIIFCDINKAKNFNFLYLKNEIKKLNSKSFISNQKLIKFNNEFLDLMFLGSHILIILAQNLEILLKLITLLKNEGIWFFFLNFNNLSSVTNIKKFFSFRKKLNILFNFNLIIYKLIIKIFLILYIFIRLIFILFTFK